MSKTALLTGSSGFVGRHMLAELLKRGYDVRDQDLKNIGKTRLDDNPRGHDTRYVLSSPILDRHYDLVVHCAAVIGGRAKIDGSPLEVAYDFGLDSDVIQFCARTKPGRVVLFSSSAIYSVARQTEEEVSLATGALAVPHRPLTLHESEIPLDYPFLVLGQPDSIYGWTKLALEIQARELANLGIPVHVFRPFSGYGPDQDEDYPWPAIMRRVAAQQHPLGIWSDPGQARDWIHIDDIVAQVMACVDRDVCGPINLCTGVPTTFLQLVQTAITELNRLLPDAGYDPQIQTVPGMPTGVHWRVGNPTAINLVRPAQIDVADGAHHTLAQLVGLEQAPV